MLIRYQSTDWRYAMANSKVVELIKGYAAQGLKPSEIMEELKAKRMKASKNQILYYLYKKPAKTGASASVNLERGSSFHRALKVLETDVLTADEKVTIATSILKAKPSA